MSKISRDEVRKTWNRLYLELLPPNRAELKAALEETFHLKGHPKADQLFDLIYETEHHSGWEDVFLTYQDYQELLAPAEAYSE